MIKTSTFRLSPIILFRLLVLKLVAKYWWLFLTIWVITSVYLLTIGMDSLGTFMLFFSILYPFAVMMQYLYFVLCKENKILFVERYFEIDSNHMKVTADNDTLSYLNVNDIVKIIVIDNSYLIYIAKNQFLYLPFHVFRTLSDKEWFDKEIVANYLKK